jgi:nifR3 family TIM-barrel protein
MGCSTRQVSGRGAGAGMLPQPELVAETFHLLSTHLKVPVTGKIRLGWDATQQNYLEIAHIMEDNGAALIALHGRTKSQKYDGRADWEAIARLKQTVRVPVIGNGDVQSAADIHRLKAHTGCDAVMIGRAAIGNPWIFARKERADLTLVEILTAVRLHVREMVNYYGETVGLRQFRKHLKQYLDGISGVEPFVMGLLTAVDLNELERLLGEMETAVNTSEKHD